MRLFKLGRKNLTVAGKYLIIAFTFLFFGTVYSQPKINSFAPISGSAGTAVTISGTGFSGTASDNIVFFGATKAVVNSATSTSLDVTVPASASYFPISVTTSQLTAYSSKSFIPTFAGGGTLDAHSFALHIDSLTGNTPYSSFIADFDGDGRPDIAIVDGGYPSNLLIFRNNGLTNQISFDAPVSFFTGNAPYGIAVGDIDGDGKLDIVVTNSAVVSTVAIYKNVSTPGNINFAVPLQAFTGSTPFAVAIADLDGDGKPDIVVGNFNSSSISIFRNTSSNGNISVNTEVVLATAANPSSLELADIDGDGKTDIIVGNSGADPVNVFRNMSNPGVLLFTPVSGAITIGGQISRAPGDLDGDGKPDVVLIGTGDTVSVLLNNSIPGIFGFAKPVNFTIPSIPANITVSDLDGDGKPDIAVGSAENDGIYILHNNSSPGVAAFAPSANLPIQDLFSINSGDIDGDGKPDLVTTSIQNNTFSVFKNTVNGPGILSLTPSYGGSDSTVYIKGYRLSTATEVQFGGVNAKSFQIVSDTMISAVVGNGSSGNVLVTTNTEPALLSGFVYYPAPVINSFSPTSASGDSVVQITGKFLGSTFMVDFGGVPALSFVVNSDSLITADVGEAASGSVSVHSKGGVGSLSGFVYTGIRPIISSFSPKSGPVGTVVTISGTGFDSNTSTNFVYFGSVRAKVSAASSTSLTVTVPTGASFQPVSVTNSNHLTGYSAAPFSVTFPLSGKPFNLNSFGDRILFPGTDNYSSSILSADFDGDGKPDILVGYQGTLSSQIGPLSISLNTSSPGEVSFAPPICIFTTGTSVINWATIADVNGDGKPDIVVTGYKAVYVFINASTVGHIQFQQPVSIPFDFFLDFVGQVVVADFDGDGKPDIAVASQYDKEVYVFRNQCTVNETVFADPVLLTTSGTTSGLAAGDLDGDGRSDLVVTDDDINTASINVFRNTGSFGNIAFDQPIVIPVVPSEYNGYVSLADLNGDGKPDIIKGNAIYPNNSSIGHLSFGTSYGFTGRGAPVAVGNLDGDGKPDLSIAANGISLIRNISSSGKIVMDSALNINLMYASSSNCIQDLDGDGLPDVSFTNYGEGGAYLGTDRAFYVLRNQLNRANEPTIVSVSPDTANIGSPVVIRGWHLTGATALSFDSVAASSFKVVNDSMITAVVGKGGSGRVRASFANFTASKDSFVYLGPIIQSFSPDTVTGTGVVYVYGMNLSNVVSITFGGVPISGFLIEENKILCPVKNVASGNIVVTTIYGKDSISGFVYIPAASQIPHIQSFSPVSAKSNTTVRISGIHFTGANDVHFGSYPASSFTVINDTVVNAIVGAGASGYVYITTPYGSDSLAGFTYIPEISAPFEVTSITPSSGYTGTQVMIKGTQLSNVNSVVIPALAGSSFITTSDSTIIVTIGSSNITGLINILLYSASDTVTVGFDYLGTNPFKLLGFSGVLAGKSVLLQWSASGEQAVQTYTIQRGEDSVQLADIGSVSSLSTAGPNNYNFQDSTPFVNNSNAVWYRLRIINNNQSSTYGPSIEINMNSPLKIYPNPSNGQITVEYPYSTVSSTISIVDRSGKITQVVNLNPNTSQIVINLTALSPGLYFLKWTDGNARYTIGFFLR